MVIYTFMVEFFVDNEQKFLTITKIERLWNCLGKNIVPNVLCDCYCKMAASAEIYVDWYIELPECIYL